MPEGIDQPLPPTPTPDLPPAPPPPPPAPPTLDELVANVKTARDAFNGARSQRQLADKAVSDAQASQFEKQTAEADALAAKDNAIDELIAVLVAEK